MATLAMDDIPQFGFSSYTTTTTTTNSTTTSDDDHSGGCNFNAWSPVVNWDAFSTGSQDDFHDLIESMMDDVAVLNPDRVVVGHEDEGSNSAASDSTDVMMVDELNNGDDDDFKGLRLVHLLMAAAEALTGVNKNRDLARVILVRLKELVSPTDGSNMERLAAYYTEGLHGLLEGAGGVHHKSGHLFSNGSHSDNHPMDVLAAFQLLQDMSPYVKFGHFTANQAILEAVAHEKRVHIVDYDIMEGIQWASLMQALVARKDGPPGPHLRITALSRGGSGRRSIGTIQETGRRLTAFSTSIGQPFSFHQCRLDSDETFRPSALKLVRGEALVFNCMLHLPHFSYRSPNSVASFLDGAKTLSPRLITLVEEEMGPIGDTGFVGRFMDSLHHYSAVYDSLEAGFPNQSRARALVERVFLGPRIAGTLARIYRSREEEERDCWGEWLGGAGFKPMSISFANHCQAKLLLGLFNDGYRVEELASNKLVLGWKSRRMLSASLWSSSSDSDF
ncbi:nodulation-signaling pathway 2 protein-like [Quillaja saponaria]|uniref:Nodulation-signaling pathway 2 protein-like n=1 Tax=Quillaja saponaria TaxID=32244 RepID=A0AAD7LWX5_QUISA|nr:nodulation-signaling pathway 2 protein-like [Quillaja saponaria]